MAIEKQNSTWYDVVARWAQPLRLLLTAVFILLLPVGYQLSVLARQPDEVVEGGRPVAKAMAMLSRELGWTITYEDPPYVNADDLRDATAVPLDGRRLIVPRGGRVTLPGNRVAVRSADDTITLLDAVLESEQTPEGPVKRFRVLRSDSVLHVVPTKFLDTAGEWRTVTPVLSTHVLVKHEEISLFEFLKKLCAETTRVAGENVKLGRVPVNLVMKTKFPPGQQKGIARTLLLDVLSSTGERLTWLMLYDPTTRTYFLHIGAPGTMI